MHIGHPFAKAHARYLRDYAWRLGPGAAANPAWPETDGPRCIAVLPLRGETPDALSARLVEVAAGQALLIVVVNAPQAEQPHFAAHNAACIAAANASKVSPVFPVERAHNSAGYRAPGAGAVHAWWARNPTTGQPWLCCDARGALAAGVGSARRLGTDLALALRAHWADVSPYVRWMDADGGYPAAYFQDAPRGATDAARFARFRHLAPEDGHADAPLAEATATYDAWLRYEWAALSAVGAAGAYPPIASLLHIHAGAYAAVRGVPERHAGEDFHLLAKLSKVGPIAGPLEVTVNLAARTEVRAPVGTAAGLTALLAGTSLAARFTHPEAFLALGRILSATRPRHSHQTSSSVGPFASARGGSRSAAVESDEHLGPRGPETAQLREATTSRAALQPNPSALMQTLLALGLPLRLQPFVAEALGLTRDLLPSPVGVSGTETQALRHTTAPHPSQAAPHFAAWFDALKQRRFLRAWSGTLQPVPGPEAWAQAQTLLGPAFTATWRSGVPVSDSAPPQARPPQARTPKRAPQWSGTRRPMVPPR